MSDTKWATARAKARLLVWDAIMNTADVQKRRLLIRVYTRMAVKGWLYAK